MPGYIGIRLNVRPTRKDLLRILRYLVEVNRAYLRRRPNTAPLYRSGVVYKRERGTEDWLSIPEILARGHDDCEGLAAWRVAELNEKGIFATPELIRQGRLWHVVVRRKSGIEDPSRRLGM